MARHEDGAVSAVYFPHVHLARISSTDLQKQTRCNSPFRWVNCALLHFSLCETKSATIADITQSYEPRSPAEADDILSNLRNKQHGTTTGLRYKEVYPPLGKMIYAVWSAPIVKFWVWFLTYILFLILLGTDMMLPACMYLGVDIAVFVCTALMWLELLTRYSKNKRMLVWK